MKLSIVTTLFFSEEHIDAFIDRAIDAAESFTSAFELIIVNDGSPDNAHAIALRRAQTDSRLVIIDLTRNFGHHPAILTGIAHAKGDHVFLIDSDLEEDPAWLKKFHDLMKSSGCDVVIGVQEKRKGGLFERLTGQLFYKMFRSTSIAKYPADQTTARLMTRRFVDSLLKFPESETCFAALCELTGYDQKTITVDKLSNSETTYTLRRKLALFFNSFTSFSTAPLYFLFYFGAIISLIAFLGIIYIIVLRLMSPEPIAGWASLMVSIWFLGGFIIAALGIIGIYIAKTLTEAKRRPLTLIREKYNVESENGKVG